MPYLIGPNKAPIRPNKNKAANSNANESNSKPAMATAAAPISNTFSSRATKALSKRSASSPPEADSKKNGAMKMAPANVTSASPVSPPILNRISRTIAFFRKLSLKAEKNWHQNSGANRREARSDCDIDPSEDQGVWAKAARLPSPRLRGEGRGEGPVRDRSTADGETELAPHPEPALRPASDLSPQTGRGDLLP